MPAVLPEPPTIPELLDKLNALGHPDQIALFLEDYGIVATPCKSETCALAQYLENELGETVAVGPGEVMRFHSGDTPDERFELPPVVQQFIALFDDLEYLDLVDWDRLAGR